MNFKTPQTLFFLLVFSSLSFCGFYVQAQDVGTIMAVLEGENNKIVVGEFLPISIKLSNFDPEKKVDVIVYYKILNDKNEEEYSENETVTVEGAVSFIKRIRIPTTTKPGFYSMASSLSYLDQKQPAVSEFSFIVEEKFGGFLKNDTLSALIFIFIVIFVTFFSIYLFATWNRKYRAVFHDYSDKPKDQIIYYEILSDIISQMRLRIGDDALKIAKDIPDLEINDINGKIINIKSEPAKIVALLVASYEKISGNRVDFSLRNKI